MFIWRSWNLYFMVFTSYAHLKLLAFTDSDANFLPKINQAI